MRNMEIKTRLGIKIVFFFFFVIRCFCFALRTAIIIEVFETQLRNCIRPNFCQSYFQVEKNQFFCRNWFSACQYTIKNSLLRIKEPKLSQTFYLKRDVSTNYLSHCQYYSNRILIFNLIQILFKFNLDIQYSNLIQIDSIWIRLIMT